MATIRGTFTILTGKHYENAADSLTGTADADLIIGDAYSPNGNDFEFDQINAGAGDDTIYGDTTSLRIRSGTPAASKPTAPLPWGNPNGARADTGDGNDTYHGGGARATRLKAARAMTPSTAMPAAIFSKGRMATISSKAALAMTPCRAGRGADSVNGGDGDDSIYGDALVASNEEIADDGDDILNGGCRQ